jgi:uncharacterized protein YllA (UPF0747 family)
MLFRLGKFERKLIRHMKRAEQVTARHMHRAAHAVFPGRELQERTLNGISWLSRYGLDLVDELMPAVPTSYGKHFLVELS